MPSISIPLIGAGLVAAGGVASSVIGSNAAQSAANTQAQAAQNASNTQLSIYDQTQANLAPYNQVGQSALSQLASLFGIGTNGSTGTGPTASTAANATSALTNYPGYQFGLQQGTQALDRSAASQGLLLSGGQLKAAQQYGQGYAQQNGWQPYITQLSGLSSLGENAAATAGNQGVQTGANVAQSQLAAGQATASGIVGSANAINGGISTGLNNASLLALLSQNGGSSSGSGLSSLLGGAGYGGFAYTG